MTVNRVNPDPLEMEMDRMLIWKIVFVWNVLAVDDDGNDMNINSNDNGSENDKVLSNGEIKMMGMY